MKKIVLICFICFIAAPFSFGQEPDQRLESSRAAVIKFASELKDELMGALFTGGATAAIEICSKKAPEIAAQISKETGFKVRRTSLKIRNEANAPDEWELKTLQSFEKRLAEGEDPTAMEFSEVVEANGVKLYRYMKSIATKPPCFNCHGYEMSQEVAEKIKSTYPNDKAVGYELGQIRGAYSITQPMD